MRSSWRRGLAIAAVGALALAGCGQDGSNDQATTEDGQGAAPDEPAPDGGGTEEAPGGAEQELPDPNDDVEDGVYRGNGVVLPVPEGWALDPAAFAQGLVAAVSEDGSQQLSAQAIDTEAAEAAGQELDIDLLLDNVRQMGDPEVDEEVELEGAERAHQVTLVDMPGQQEGAPESSATIVLAEDGSGLLAEFVVGAQSDSYDEELESLLLDTAGFDPDSQPPEPVAPPAPEGGGGELEEAPEDLG